MKKLITNGIKNVKEYYSSSSTASFDEINDN